VRGPYLAFEFAHQQVPEVAPGFGRSHSSGTSVAEPNPDASYVANAIARSIVVETSKAIADEMHAFRAIRVACRWYQMHVSP